MKNTFVSLLVFLCPITALLAQDYTLSGSVENEQNEPVPYANVQLLKAADSTLVDGASSEENGLFEIGGVAEGAYLIKASYIENESGLRPIQVNGDLVLDPIVLDDAAQELQEVTVTSRKPKLEQKADRLVYNIENTAVADGDIWDVLKRTPSVIIVNDRLSVKGSGAVGILINGRKVNLPKGDIINLLSGASASDVEAIEVITNPPAKYSAEDAILINIRKKKNLVAGYNGAIFNRYKQGILPKHTIGTDHYFKGNKTGFSVNYSFAHNRDVVKYTDVTNFIQNNAIASTWTAERENLRREKKHNLSAFFDYDLNEKNRLSLSGITVWSPQRDYNNVTEATIVGDTLSGFNTLNKSGIERLNTSYYLDFVHELDKEGAELSFNAHYTYYKDELGQELNTQFFEGDGNPVGRNDFTTDTDQDINLYSVQADYLTPMGESASFETGLRYAGIASKNEVIQQGFDRNRPGVNPTETGSFDYDESIYAGYASFSGNWDAWSLKSGLRAEYTETDGVSNVVGQNTENDYLELFPSVSLQYIPQEDHKLTAYYNRKIQRPRYDDINPFQVFLGNFSTTEGNTRLLPELRNYMAAGYTFKSSYKIEFFYSLTKNRLQELAFQDNETQLLRFISSNIDSKEAFGVDFTISKEFTDFWYSYILASFFDETNAFRNLGSDALTENNQFAWFVNTTNSFTFLEDASLTADLSLYYQGPKFVGNSRYDGFGSLNLLFRKTFWNRTASISIGIDDIFNQGNQFSRRDYLDQNGTSLLRAENRLFVLGLRYKFGNTKIRDNWKSKHVDEQDRL